jgi:sulfide:quinone oxidoreductase
LPLPGIIEAASRAGYDLKGLVRRIINGGKTPVEVADAAHDVVIIGGGAAGIATAASLLARSPNLDVAIIDPADIHYYQPGWTMVGAGVFNASFTARTMASLLPHGVHWIKAAVAAILIIPCRCLGRFWNSQRWVCLRVKIRRCPCQRNPCSR